MLITPPTSPPATTDLSMSLTMRKGLRGKVTGTEPHQAEADAVIGGDVVQNSQSFCLTENHHDTSAREEQGPSTLAQSHRKCCLSSKDSLFLGGSSEPTRICMCMSTWGTYRKGIDRHTNQKLRYTHGFALRRT